MTEDAFMDVMRLACLAGGLIVGVILAHIVFEMEHRK